MVVLAAIAVEFVAALPAVARRMGSLAAAGVAALDGALRQSERVRYRGPHRVARRLAVLGAFVAAFSLAAPPALAAPKCGTEWASAAGVGRPSARLAWRAELLARTPLWSSGPGRHRKSRGSIVPRDAPWLLVLRAAPDRMGRCWLRVRLPSRPNDAAAWLNADRVLLRSTPWRIVVSRRARSISVYRDGERLRRFGVVVGAPATPSPRGLFSIVGVWRWHPADFLGSYILPLTAHSNVLQSSAAVTAAWASTAAAGPACWIRSELPAVTAASAWRTARSIGSSAQSAPTRCPAFRCGARCGYGSVQEQAARPERP